MCWDENRKHTDVDESDDGCDGPLHANGSLSIRYDDTEAIDDELQYKMDLEWSA